MTSLDHWHTLPSAHALQLLEVVKRWHVEGDVLLEGTGLTRDSLSDPQARLTVPVLSALLERARLLTGEPALGLYIGLQTRATLYGHLGFAVVSASTIREAIEVALRYGPTHTTAYTLRFREEKRQASLIVEEHADFGSARDTFLIARVVALWQISRSLTTHELKTSVAELALPEPSYVERLRAAPIELRFGRPMHRLVFDPRSLDIPYTMPDPVAAKLAREQCERDLEALGLSAGLAERVRGLIAKPTGGARGLDEVAAVMKRSPRTLRRQLDAQGVRFSTLRDRELYDRARVLLRSPDLTLADIAARLGYSNVTNFERAFHRWSHTTPAQHRRDARAGVGG
jgi:AraC-like DNA-binding protein